MKKEELFPGISDIATGISAFVGARRKEGGGYGATPMLPATIEDTYYGLRIMSALNKVESPDFIQDRALKNYLTGLLETDWVGARTTFHLLAACRMAKVAIDTENAFRFVQKRMAQNSGLGERYYCFRIIHEIIGQSNDFRMEPVADHCTRAVWRDATELWLKLYQWDEEQTVKETPLHHELVYWLQACQNSDGGFGFLPGTTSFIENCYTCLRALHQLDAAPLNPGGCQSFLMSCRTGTGGFARASKAVAFLYSTWYGMAALNILKVF